MPSKRPLVFSLRARRDVHSIEAYTLAQWDEQQWAGYEAALGEALDAIHDHPEIGRPRPELGGDIRSYVVREHIIYYRLTEAMIRVLRIRPGRINPSRALRG